MPADTPYIEEGYWPTGGRRPVTRLTAAAYGFIAEHSRLLDLNVFVIQSRLRHLLENDGRNPDQLSDLFHEFDRQELLLCELIICRVVDNYLTYLAELLALIYKSRPEMLRSSEQERLDYILQFESLDELRAGLAEKRVERLAYLGLKDLAEHFHSQMGFDLFPTREHLKRATLIVEYRNLLVHNRGVVSSISARRTPELRKLLGSRLEFDRDEVTLIRKFLENAMLDIDLRASEKFALPCKEVPEPPPHLS